MNYKYLIAKTVFLLFLFSPNIAKATIFYSNQSGDWNTGSTWDIGTVPMPEDTIYIHSGHTVTISDNNDYTHTGDLIIRPGAKLVVDCGNSQDGFIFDGGSFHVYGDLELTNSPDKTLRITGNSLFWAHNGAAILVSEDLQFEGNSTNIIENVCIEVDDDAYLIGTDATICGRGGASLGTNSSSNRLVFEDGASTDQICVGTGIYRGPGGNCSTPVAVGTGNNEPIAYPDTTITSQDTPIPVDVLRMGTVDMDTDGDQIRLTYATGISISGPTQRGGLASINDNGTPDDYTDDYIDYTPPSGFNGEDTFDYTISDGNGGIGIATVTITVSAVLPVTLTEFKVREVNCEAQIQWTTANELDNREFLLQRSSDGENWSTIASFEGVGTTHETTHYAHHDRDIQPLNYYRLKQVDFDGSIHYSQIIQLTSSCSHRLSRRKAILDISPNPVGSSLVNIRYVTTRADMELMIISDLNGRIIQKTIVDFEAGINNLRLDLNHLSSGTYFVQIGRSQYKLIKIHD